MEEDLRLAADRDTLHQKVEIEKMKTQMQEVFISICWYSMVSSSYILQSSIYSLLEYAMQPLPHDFLQPVGYGRCTGSNRTNYSVFLQNMREQQTQQLYHQMQEAQENALRDKLVKRQQLLKIRGHDTSRLERTHQMALQ